MLLQVTAFIVCVCVCAQSSYTRRPPHTHTHTRSPPLPVGPGRLPPRGHVTPRAGRAAAILQGAGSGGPAAPPGGRHDGRRDGAGAQPGSGQGAASQLAAPHTQPAPCRLLQPRRPPPSGARRTRFGRARLGAARRAKINAFWTCAVNSV